MTRTMQLCILVAAAALAAAAPLPAQQARRAAAARDGGIAAHVLALGSVGADPGRPHFAGGGLVQFGYGRVSLLGLGTLGRGGDYTSVLAGGGVGLRVVGIGRVELTAFGGYGHYAEEGWSGIERDAGGILAGAIASARLGRATVAFAFSDLTGEYGEDDVVEPFRFHVPRLSIGIGL